MDHGKEEKKLLGKLYECMEIIEEMQSVSDGVEICEKVRDVVCYK